MSSFISLETAQSILFHPFDALGSLQSSLWDDPSPKYDMYAVNQLSRFEPSVVTENRLSLDDAQVQNLLSFGEAIRIYEFIESGLHIKYTSLYAVERYLEGKIPGTLDSFGQPYVPSERISLAAFARVRRENAAEAEDSEEEKEDDEDEMVPFYLTPKFFVQHVTPPYYNELRDPSLRPHFAELMHFRDRYPYVETSFLYLQNILRRRAHYLFAYHYYGSFQGVQQLYRHMVDKDEVQDLCDSSPYFRQKLRKLFFVHQEDLAQLHQELSGEGLVSSRSTSSTSRSRAQRAWLRQTDKLKMYPLYIKQLPVHIQLMEKLEGVNMYSFLLQACTQQLTVSEHEIMSVLLQVALQLEMYDRLFQFRHNDLHGQNVMIGWLPSSAEWKRVNFDFQDSDRAFQVPLFPGKVARIIDFGRVHFSLGQENYFSDEMSPWGAVNDHCNVKSSVYFQRALRQRPVPKSFDFAYFCCMITQYISFMGGTEAYRFFLEKYPIAFEFMYESTKKADGTSFLDSGMQYIRDVVSSYPRRKRRLANYRLIKPEKVLFSEDLVLDIISDISPRIDLLHLLQTHPRISAFCADECADALPYREQELRKTLQQHFQVEETGGVTEYELDRRARALDTHKVYQSQVLHQIRRDFRGKTQNPFTGIQRDERDADDFEDTFR